MKSVVDYETAFGHVGRWLESGESFGSIANQVELVLPRSHPNNTSFMQASNWRAALDDYNPAYPRSLTSQKNRHESLARAEVAAAPEINGLRSQPGRSMKEILGQFRKNGGRLSEVSLMMPALKHPAEIEAFVQWAFSKPQYSSVRASVARAAEPRTLGEMAPGTQHVWKGALEQQNQLALQKGAPDPAAWNG